MGDPYVVVLRGFPGLGSGRAGDEQRAPRETPRFWRRPAVVLHAGALLGALPESFGLGAALVVMGPSVLSGSLLVPDGLTGTGPAALARLEAWAQAHPLTTTTGARPWRLATVREFFDPYATAEKEPAKPWAFQPTAYEGGGFVVGANLGQTFGLVAEHVVVARGRRSGSWQVWLPGWGVRGKASSVRRRSPHRPCLYLRARRAGWQVSWGPCGQDNSGKPAGKRDKAGNPFEGLFVDVISLAYALDADRGASFAEHCEDLGVEPFELPVSVRVDEQGAEVVTAAVVALHGLALRLDEEAGKWFTNSKERRAQRGRLDLVRTSSPGALAAQVLERSGLRRPLDQFDLSQAELAQWAEASYGGWCEANIRFVGAPYGAVSADISSAYPLVAHHLSWWELVSAKGLRREAVTEALVRACEIAATKPTEALDPELWQRFGATLVEVMADGERFPVTVEDRHRPDDRMEVVPVRSARRSLFYSWPDVLAAAVLSGRVPKVLGAVRLVPEGVQPTRRPRLAVLPALVLDLSRDPAVAIVGRRRAARRAGDQALAAELKVVVNSLVFGGFCRFDEVTARQGRSQVVAERPGPWNFLPVSTSVTAGARLLLAVLERLICDLGGAVAYRDTDSGLVVASPDGGGVAVADGPGGRALSWAEVDHVLGAFEVLSPEPAWPVWKTERGTRQQPLQAVVFGAKRHVEWSRSGPLLAGEQDDDKDHFDATEANLGGTYADPPAMLGRVAPLNGYRRWSMAAVRREADRARSVLSPAGLGEPAAWDLDQAPFPAVRRFIVKRPDVVRCLPAVLGARPGTRYLEVATTSAHGARVLVALDPGADLSGWQGLGFIDKRSGQPVAVTTEPANYVDARLVTLDDKACAWSRPPRAEPIDEVIVDPALVRHKGRVSGLIDAVADEGTAADLAARRPSYGRACGCGCGAVLSSGRRHRQFVNDTHRKRAARARRGPKPGERPGEPG